MTLETRMYKGFCSTECGS
jgi:predicted metal-dependent hydrolase